MGPRRNSTALPPMVNTERPAMTSSAVRPVRSSGTIRRRRTIASTGGSMASRINGRRVRMISRMVEAKPPTTWPVMVTMKVRAK